jgi:hypothetical protein
MFCFGEMKPEQLGGSRESWQEMDDGDGYEARRPRVTYSSFTSRPRRNGWVTFAVHRQHSHSSARAHVRS